MQPVPDASQDYTLLSASEEGGYTELMFERPRDTNDDDEDLLFMVSTFLTILVNVTLNKSLIIYSTN